jgi:hypothetical protein
MTDLNGNQLVSSCTEPHHYCQLLYFRLTVHTRTHTMAGFVLGTGSGILASAAVYYTLSTSLHRDTAAVQHQ